MEDTSILEDVLSRGIDLDNVSEADSSVTYYVSGYIARSISRRRKCQSCKEMLIKNDEMPSIVDFAKNTLLELANRGGLAVPSDYCFAVSTLAVQAFDALTSDDSAKKKLLQCNNQRCAFVQAVCNSIQSINLYASLKEFCCEQGHHNFENTLQTA